MKTYSQKKCARKTDKDWKHPRCLSISEWNIVIQQQEEMRRCQATKRNGGHLTVLFSEGSQSK